MKKALCLMALLCLFSNIAAAQNIKQTIRGTILDQENKIPLIGANIKLMTVGDPKGTSTDFDGNFSLEDIPVGRHDVEVSYLGYETLYLNGLLLNSGKELVLNLEMQESTATLETVTINAQSDVDKTKPLNSFATLSSRTFSVEETSRYAASAYDPARMAQNYAGVSTGSGYDLYNQIVIRGNSPSGILWRLEGIEIPNPNHFGSMGNSGGAISMLSSTTLNNSDFYTGAFPAEFGNATSGVFDLNMRSGNNQKRENSIMIGALGVEFGAEGPFSKKSKASYLVNYRYSTLAILQGIGVNPTGDVLPTYQDLSFKVNVPTKNAGTFSLFGLGGDNLAATNPAQDSTQWNFSSDRIGFAEKISVGTIGLSHRKLVGDNSYFRTVAIVSREQENEDEFYLQDNYAEYRFFEQRIRQNTFRVSSLFHKKLSAKHSIRFGAIYSLKDFNLNIDESEELTTPMINIFTGTGQTGVIQGYAQSKFRINQNLKLNTGIHYTHLGSNNTFSIEPRMALNYSLGKGKEIGFSTGLHSRLEHLTLYTLEGEFDEGEKITANPDLSPTKAWHNVISYDHVITPNIRLKLEAYYQHLYDVVISDDPTSSFTLLNAFDIWDYFGLSNAKQSGIGRNIGIDMTLEKFFADSYYLMFTGSLYDSKYKTGTDRWYSTRFNGNYQSNFIGGKEFKVGKNGKNIIGLNGKFVLAGGSRYTEIDLPASIEAGYTVRFWDKPNEAKNPAYYRLDVGASYRINTKRMTHTIMFDIQNVTNRENQAIFDFNEDTGTIEPTTHVGLFPFVNYRIEF